MTLDKIKYYLNPIIFEYWTSLHKAVPQYKCRLLMEAAYIQLTNEIESKVRENSVQVQAEIKLLKILNQNIDQIKANAEKL